MRIGTTNKRKPNLAVPACAMLALFMSVFLSPALAGTPLTPEQANNYYQSCNAQRDQRMSEATQDAFCACTSAEMMSRFSVEDIQLMNSGEDGARDVVNRMILDIYAPCMHYPVQDLTEIGCLQDSAIEKIDAAMPRDDLCRCMGETTGHWFSTEGRALMATILEQNPTIEDPMTPLMQSAEFRTRSHENMLACLQTYR